MAGHSHSEVLQAHPAGPGWLVDWQYTIPDETGKVGAAKSALATPAKHRHAYSMRRLPAPAETDCYISKLPPEIMNQIFEIVFTAESRPSASEIQTMYQLALKLNKPLSSAAQNVLWRWPVLSTPGKIDLFCETILSNPAKFARLVRTLDIRPSLLTDSWSEKAKQLAASFLHGSDHHYEAFAHLGPLERLYLYLPSYPSHPFAPERWLRAILVTRNLQYACLTNLFLESPNSVKDFHAFLDQFTGHLELLRPHGLLQCGIYPFPRTSKLSIEQCSLGAVFTAFNKPGEHDNLHVLHLRNCWPLYGHSVSTPKWESLQELWLDVSGDNSEVELQHLSNLTKLTIEGGHNGTLERQLWLLPHSLNELHLVSCHGTRIFQQLVVSMLSNLGELRKLVVETENLLQPVGGLNYKHPEVMQYYDIGHVEEQAGTLDFWCRREEVVSEPSSFLETMQGAHARGWRLRP